MGNDQVSETSKKLSWLLRHGAGKAGLSMDEAGWAPVEEVLAKLQISRELLVQAVEENSKARLEMAGGRIRACQGHSLEGMPVTREALEASWSGYTGAGPLWHGTSVDAVPSILREGILAVGRTHVHLAEATDSKVGKRARVDMLLEVSVAGLRAAGLGIFRSSNGVLLVRYVPPSCLVGVIAQTPSWQVQASWITRSRCSAHPADSSTS
ncbi:MAG: RNA 2'-phosphotransferase [Myxococcales bacterium]|nr:RNA 2'-phosphotransferase [Polyangiaceae bacterium]MDW8248075.1 RNA 2'-phosphotransferase [Myxococcales bacterium]